jgi:Histone methylation protein DOT1
MTLIKRSLIYIFISSILLISHGCSTLEGNKNSSEYKPVRGQFGKDVMWIATTQELVDKMLDMANVTDKDVLYDLGSGDGIVPITASKRFNAQSVGIEFNPKLADYARAKVIQENVKNKVTIITGDIFKEDFSNATVVFMYLLPELNLELRPKLLNMKPGTRIVSHYFDMSDWYPDQIIKTSNDAAYLWVIPAKIAGKWEFLNLETKKRLVIEVDQIFQKIGGTITMDGVAQPLLSPRLSADQLSFFYQVSNLGLVGVTLKIKDNQMQGVQRFLEQEVSVEAVRLK